MGSVQKTALKYFLTPQELP